MSAGFQVCPKISDTEVFQMCIIDEYRMFHESIIYQMRAGFSRGIHCRIESIQRSILVLDISVFDCSVQNLS